MKQIYDVIVVGGGPAGIMAAMASGKLGADTLLIEKNGFLGERQQPVSLARFLRFIIKMNR